MVAAQHTASSFLAPELSGIPCDPAIVAWLQSEENADPRQELDALREHLATVARADLAPADLHRLIDAFFHRTRRLSLALQPHLVAAALPLEQYLRSIAEGLRGVYAMLEDCYCRLIEAPGEDNPRTMQPASALLAGAALNTLLEQVRINIHIASPAPAKLWLKAHRLYRLCAADGEDPTRALDADVAYKAMVAQAAAQPEGFSPAEAAILQAYLQRYAMMVDLLDQRPDDGSASWFWMDTDRDIGPTPSNRRIPARHGRLMFISCVRLAHRLDEHLNDMERGASLKDLKLPDLLAPNTAISFLRRVQQYWNSPPHRHFSRRPHSYRAQLCAGLENFWHLLKSGDTSGNGDAARTTEWTVTNESPAGFSVMHVSGTVEGLRIGSLIALRASADDDWKVCIVRWMRSENAEHIELGLELVSPNAESVSLLFRDDGDDQQPKPGLLLPPGTALRRHPAIIAPSGSYSSRRFFIIPESGKAQMSRGRLLSLDLQTDSVELFQFEAEPS